MAAQAAMARGRKRKDGPRDTSGRLKRPSWEPREDVRETAYEARTRLFGVSRSQAAAMPETSFLGLLRASDAISQRQYDAAMKFRQVMEDYHREHPIKGYPHVDPLHGGGGYEGEPSERDWYQWRRAWDGFDMANVALMKACAVDHRARAVVEAVVLNDAWQPHTVDALKIGLDHIADAFGLS